MSPFIKGRELSRRFFNEAALPILEECFPKLRYSAGLLGYGSDVLGYDDVVSTDHMWGPRFYLFLNAEDMYLRNELMEVFSVRLPSTFLGYSVNFSDSDTEGIRHAEAGSGERVSPLIFMNTLEDYLKSYLGYQPDELSEADWLSFSEHKLLAVKKAEFYRDDLKAQERLKPLAFYPEDVKRYLLASNWSLISEEQAFVKRQMMTGDTIGSVCTAARIAERLMRLCFLYCNTYAPYSKWFGKAFCELPIQKRIIDKIREVVTKEENRGQNVAEAQRLVAELHNAKYPSIPVKAEIGNYFGRDIKVIYADRIADAISQAIQNNRLRKLPLIGSMSEVANMVRFYDNPNYRGKIKSLYED